MISRRSFLAGMGALTLQSRASIAQDDAFVSVIDTTSDTSVWIDKLKGTGVQIVGRYYARGLQGGSLKHKRLAYNAGETDKLLDQGFAILSEYQYKNSDPSKFLFGIDEVTGPCGTDHESVARAEARLDAEAARAQATAVKQPPQTAIYFGIDFDLSSSDSSVIKYEVDKGAKKKGERINYVDGTPVRNIALKKAVVAYFDEVNNVLGNDYLIGVYGNGFVSRLLKNREKPLISYTWLSGSLGHSETAEVLKTEDGWHLFQNQLDRTWYGKCGEGMDVDTNIQNPRYSEIGAWNRNGRFQAPIERLRKVTDNRKVAKRRITVLETMDLQSSPTKAKVCYMRKSVSANPISRGKTIRVIATRGDWLEVDVDDDGRADGFIRNDSLGALYKGLP